MRSTFSLSMIRFNEVLAPFYQRLRANGKPGRVAIVAAMRKLVVHLNGLMGKRAVGTQDSSPSSETPEEISQFHR